MYCPRCATQNLDGVKFCRSCGTNIEAVALALAGRLDSVAASRSDAKDSTGRTGLEKRSEGLKKLARATGLLGSSALVGAALALFSNEPDWIILWVVFAGWMACLGMISLTTGIAALIESRLLRKTERVELVGGDPATWLVESPATTAALGTPELSRPPSVTEYTTKTLGKRRPQ